MGNEERVYAIIGLIVAILSCIAAYISLPQLQNRLNPSSTASQPASIISAATPEQRPVSTVPVSTVPVSTVPVSTVPIITPEQRPVSTVPVSTIPIITPEQRPLTTTDTPQLATPLSGNTVKRDKLAKVEIADLQTYNHTSGTFSINVPTNWGEPEDKTRSGEVLVVFSDPHQNAQIVADIFEKPSGDLGQFLADFIKKSYKDEPNFSMDDPQTQKDGSVRVSFQYDVTVQGVTATMLGNSFIEDHDDKASVVSFVVPQDQFKALQPKIDNIVNSFKVHNEAKIQ